MQILFSLPFIIILRATVAILSLVPQRIIRSAGHAFRGLSLTVRTEQNFLLLAMFYPLILLCAFFLFLKTWEWFALLSSGGLVLCTELLNTATERLADALDDYCKREHRENCFTAIRSAKDTAAAASLVSFTILLMVIAIIFFPRLLLIFTA